MIDSYLKDSEIQQQLKGMQSSKQSIHNIKGLGVGPRTIYRKVPDNPVGKYIKMKHGFLGRVVPAENFREQRNIWNNLRSKRFRLLSEQRKTGFGSARNETRAKK